MRTSHLLAAALLFVLLVNTVVTNMAFAQQDTRLVALRSTYQNAMSARGDVINQAMAVVDLILKSDPRNALAHAYKGSLLTLMGGEAILPWTKLRYVNGGIDMMDEAISDLADSGLDEEARAETLMVCAFTNSSLPGMFKRAPIARQQIDTLIQGKAFDTIGTRNQARALATAAAYAKADGDSGKSAQLLTRAKTLDAAEAMEVFNARG